MNLTKLLLNTHQYDIQEVVDNSVEKIKEKRRQQREQELLKKQSEREKRDKERERINRRREDYIQKRMNYQKQQQQLSDFDRKYRVKPSTTERMRGAAAYGLEKAGEKLQRVDVTDPQQLGRNLARGIANLPTKLTGKTLSAAGKKITDNTKKLSAAEYDRKRDEILRQEASGRYDLDKAERKAEVHKRIPNPLKKKTSTENQPTTTKPKGKKPPFQTAASERKPEPGKQGPSKSEMEKMTPQQLAALAGDGEPKTTPTKQSSVTPSTTTQKTQTTQQPSPSLQQRKEKSFGSRMYSRSADAAKSASNIRAGKKPVSSDISLDIPSLRMGRPTFPSKPQTTQQTQSQPQTQQPTRSLSDRRKFTANIKPNQFFQSTMAGTGKPLNRPKPQQPQTTQPTMNQPEPTKKPSRSLPIARQRPLPAQRLVGRKSRISPTQTNSDQTGFGDN